MNYNKVILSGRLVRDPETRYTNQDTAIVKFGLAVEDGFKDKKKTYFFDVTMLGKRAETFAQYHQKGSEAFIEGKLEHDTWQDKQTGQKRSKVAVVAFQWEFIGGGKGKKGPSVAEQGPSHGTERQLEDAWEKSDTPF